LVVDDLGVDDLLADELSCKAGAAALVLEVTGRDSRFASAGIVGIMSAAFAKNSRSAMSQCRSASPTRQPSATHSS
jgi:hypothetical protein